MNKQKRIIINLHWAVSIGCACFTIFDHWEQLLLCPHSRDGNWGFERWSNLLNITLLGVSEPCPESGLVYSETQILNTTFFCLSVMQLVISALIPKGKWDAERSCCFLGPRSERAATSDAEEQAPAVSSFTCLPSEACEENSLIWCLWCLGLMLRGPTTLFKIWYRQ